MTADRQTVERRRMEKFTVAAGAGMDVCPLCGIWRMNAGFVRESCGASFVKPGCFVQPKDDSRAGGQA